MGSTIGSDWFSLFCHKIRKKKPYDFSGPLLALALAREDAVSGWREKLGPKEVDKAQEEAPDSLR